MDLAFLQLIYGFYMAHKERGLLDLIEGWLMAHKVRMDETKMLSPYRPRTDQRIPTPVAFCGFWGPFTVSSAGIFPGVGGLIGGWNRVSERVSYVGHEFGRERFRGERHRRGFVKKWAMVHCPLGALDSEVDELSCGVAVAISIQEVPVTGVDVFAGL
ncbi:hypothetical protein WG66_006737 [Moniliophthora roreri]|nr:hypothetical protein WG66_006737 [Moniliophthora roreri]